MTRSAGCRTGLRRGPAVILGGLLVASILAGGCSLPISMPLPSMTAASAPVEATGSTTAEVVDGGLAERIGTAAWEALRTALVSAAERGEDGQVFAWKAADAAGERGAEGTVTAVDAFFDEGGAVCRRLAITAVAYQRSEAFSAEACRRDGGGWNVRPLGGEA